MNFILYSASLEPGTSRSTSREAEGPALRSLGNLPTRCGAKPGRMSSEGRKEKE
jgi:hypothetical protein